MSKHTIQELQQKQMLPLSAKIQMTEDRISEWVDKYGIDGVYVSFSGGKDSTVLINIARKMYPDIKAVFFDTGLEYPEIRNLVKTYDNVDFIRPKLTFKQTIEKYGYPFISKEVADCVYGARRYLFKLISEEHTLSYGDADSQFNTIKDVIDSMELRKIIESRPMRDGERTRLARILGILTKDNKIKADIDDCDKSKFTQSKWEFFLQAPFEISSKCCNVMKKSPAHFYTKQTGRLPITAQMASESTPRTIQWMKSGCNGFNLRNPMSNPMSFWLEQDVLLFLAKYHIPIASVYGDIVDDYGNKVDLTDYEDNGVFELDRPLLKTTGCERTGCMFCGFGCHQEEYSRFAMMKETHPKQYDYIMRPKIEGGLGFKEVIDWINEHSNMEIKY